MRPQSGQLECEGCFLSIISRPCASWRTAPRVELLRGARPCAARARKHAHRRALAADAPTSAGFKPRGMRHELCHRRLAGKAAAREERAVATPSSSGRSNPNGQMRSGSFGPCVARPAAEEGAGSGEERGHLH